MMRLQTRVMIAGIVAALVIGAKAFADDDSKADDNPKIELPVVGSVDWIHWAENETLRHIPSEPSPMTSLSEPPSRSTPLSAASVAPPSDKPASHSDEPISASPIVNLRGLRDPRVGGKLDARLVEDGGLSLEEINDPVQRRRETNVGFYEGPLKVEAAQSTRGADSMRGPSTTTTLGTQLFWSKTSLWSRYSPDGRTLGFGITRPIATGFSWSTQWSESLFDRRVMFGINADPTAAWNLLHDAVR